MRRGRAASLAIATTVGATLVLVGCASEQATAPAPNEAGSRDLTPEQELAEISELVQGATGGDISFEVGLTPGDAGYDVIFYGVDDVSADLDQLSDQISELTDAPIQYDFVPGAVPAIAPASP